MTRPAQTPRTAGQPLRLFPASTLALALVALPGGSLAAQECWLRDGVTPEQAAQRPSPRDSAQVAFGGGTLKVCYGAPSARGRSIVGGLNPHGEPWRMGADEATALHLPAMAMAGSVHLDAGVYSIFAVPGPTTWTVVFNRQSERWGIPIDDAVRQQDVGQLTVRTETLSEPVERLRYRFEPRGGGVDLVFEFERNRVRVPLNPMQ